MVGWIVITLLVAGAALYAKSSMNEHGTAEQRMSDAFVGLIGIVLFFAGLLVLFGATLWRLF